MPIFEAKDIDPAADELALFALLHATPEARDAARERGRARIERPTMVPGLVHRRAGEADLTGPVAAPVP